MRLSIWMLVLVGSAVRPVHAQDGKDEVRLEALTTRFRVLMHGGSLPRRAQRMGLLRDIARIRNEKAMQFLVDVVRSPRHVDIEGDVMRLLAKVGPDSGVVAAVFRERLRPNDPHRRRARDFLLARAEHKLDHNWLASMFAGKHMEDRFLALKVMGNIGSMHTLRSVWTLLRDRKWTPESGTAVTCSTIAHAVRSFEGPEAARLLLLLHRDARFQATDRAALRDSTRLWASGHPRSYVRISDLAHPDAANRAESARFMGAAGIESARAPLLFLARNPSENAMVRAAAAEALGGLTIARGALARDLRRLLRDPEEKVRFAAVAGLGRLRVKTAAFVLADLIGTPLEKRALAALTTAYGEMAGDDWKYWIRECGLPEGT